MEREDMMKDEKMKQRASLFAGLGYLLNIFLAPFAQMFVIASTIVPGDGTATAKNIMENEMLFRVAIFMLVVNIVADIVVVWGLYNMFKRENKTVSLLAAWFGLVYCAIFACSLTNLLSALQLAELIKPETNSYHYTQIIVLCRAYIDCWGIGFVFFGIRLILVGYLLIKSFLQTKVLGIFVVLAGVGYLIDTMLKMILNDYETEVAVFTFWGELLLTGWLLWKGFRGFQSPQK